MKLSNTRSTLMILLMISSGAFLLNSSTSTHAQSVGQLSPNITPGQTIWYDVIQFTSFDELISDANVTVTGTLAGSRLYAKVMDINDEVATFWDGGSFQTSAIPVIDTSVGMITGTDIAVTGDINGTVETLTLPAGSGLPFPIIFGTVTQFNVSSLDGVILPVPMVLNDNYALHETIVSQLANQVPGIDIINNPTTFRIELDISETFDNGTTLFVNGFVEWRKSDGLLNDLGLNIGDGLNSFDLRITLDVIEFVPLKLVVGDTFNIGLDEFTLDYLLTGLPAAEAAEVTNGFEELQSSMDAVLGETVVHMEVVEIKGLYYKLDGFIQDPVSGNLTTFDELTNNEGIWMNGFGTLSYNIPRITGLLILIGNALTVESCYYDAYGNYICDSSGPLSLDQSAEPFWNNDMRRLVSLPGIVVTGDWDIYMAFDRTISAVVDIIMDFASREFTDGSTFIVDISSGISIVNGQELYQFKGSTAISVTDLNGTDITAGGSFELNYNMDGRLDSLVLDSQVFVTNSGQAIEFDVHVKISTSLGDPIVITDPVTNTTDPTSSTSDSSDNTTPTTPTDTDTAPEVLPGFEMYLALVSLLGLIFIRRKRN